MKASKVICETMIKQGVEVVFGITGGAIMPLYDYLYDYQDKIKNIIARHEQGAVHAAEGYARAIGRVGTALSTSGPGGTNMVTGIMDAFMDSVPIVAMGGQVATTLIGNDAFQETDMMGITMPITKHSFQLRDPNDAASTIIKAYKIAISGRPGPVYIDLPKDMQNSEVTKPIPKDVDIPSYKPTINPNPLQLKKASELIMNAERPLIMAGGGVNISLAHKELFKFVETLWIPVVTTTMGKGCFPEDHPLSLGVTGMHGTEQANWSVINCDLLIAIGCRFSDRVTGELKSFQEGKKIIHIDIDPSEIGKNVKAHVPIVGDVK
ncbi:MAG: thiamine pyrophosphate-binding protein, partial [Nanoarchaeota archaeon]